MTENMSVETFAMLVRQSEKVRADFCKDVGITLDEYYVKQNGDFEIEDMVRAFQKGFGMALIPLQSQLTKKDKRIADLEAEVKEWKDKANLWCKTANLKDHNIMINKELEQENARLKEINTHTISRLNLDNGELLGIIQGKDKAIQELKKQLDWKEKALAKAKKEVQRIADRVNKDKRRLIRRKHENEEQLTKAKELLKNLLSAYTSYADSFDDRDNDIVAEAEQFLREVEK